MAYYDKKKKFSGGGGGRSGGGGGGGGKGRFNLENYVEVKQRVEEFVRDFPNGSIQTFLAAHDGPEVIMEARVFRTAEDVRVGAYTSGFAREVEGKGNAMINGTSHLENCFSADTEVLTERGWMTIADLCEANDLTVRVASYNPETGATQFAAPLMYVMRTGTQTFLCVEDNLTKQRVTPDHRVLVGTDILTANELLAADTHSTRRPAPIPHSGLYSGGTGLFADEWWARFRQWVIADGCVVEDQNLIRFGFKKERKVARLTEVLRNAGIEHSVADPSARGVISVYVKGLDATKAWKTLSVLEVLQMTAAEAQAFLSEVVHTDGTLHTRGGIYLRTTDRPYVEALSTLATLHGWEATSLKFDEEPGPSRFPNAKPTSRVLLYDRPTRRLHRQYRVEFGEGAYCLSTVDGTVVTRLDGKITISGQCETSAVGRALANMGYGTTKNRASRSEMVKVSRMQQEHQDMVDWISTYFGAIPEGAVATLDGDEADLVEFIEDNADRIKEEYKLCRLVVSAVEKATGETWS
jgi:hypothetical protein